MSVVWEDFNPINTWKPDFLGPRWTREPEIPKHLIDETTGRKYWNESEGCVQGKCILLTVGTPIVHAITSVGNAALRILKLVFLFHFWIDSVTGRSSSFKDKLKEAGKDFLRVLFPLIILGLECAAIYGMFSPYNGRKLYATIERAAYGESVLAPCFQPDPKFHAFGGNIDERDAF